MRHSLVLFLLILAGVPTLQARICGTRYVAQSSQRFPLVSAKPLIAQQEKEEITVGTQLDFPVFNRFGLMQATCRYVGEHCYVFVEDVQWDTNGGPVVQQDVDELGELFDRSTPVDTDRGVYQLEVETFGEPPDVDGYEPIFLLVLDTNDDNLIGFFDRNVSTQAVEEWRRDSIYLNERAVRRRRYLARGTLAHEFQHLIHWGHDSDEEIWVNEGLSGYAEELAGYPEADPAAVPAFVNRPDINLTEWQPVREEQAYNYGSSYLFMSFLAEKYGNELIRRLVDEPRNGTSGIDQTLGDSGLDRDFTGVWMQWIAGNYAADDPVYGYTAMKNHRILTFAAPSPPFEGAQGIINNQWGTTTVVFRTPGNIEVEFSGEAAGRYRVWLYAMRNETGDLQELELDAENTGRIEVLDVDSLAVIAGRTSPQGGLFELSARNIVVPTAVSEEAGPGLARKPGLGALYPNPFNRRALIPFVLPAAADMELSLYNSLGQQIRVLRQGFHQAGRYEIVWDGRDRDGNEVGSGTYLVVLLTESERMVRGMMLVK